MTTATIATKRNRQAMTDMGILKPGKDIEETVAGMWRQIKAIEAKAEQEDPWVAAEMIRMSEALETAGVRVIGKLRAAGYTWHDIGFELGLSATTTIKRYAKRIGGRR